MSDFDSCEKDLVAHIDEIPQPASNLTGVIDSTVRITIYFEIKDIFNQEEIYDQGQAISTGFFINEHGHILTCHHAIEDSVKIFINVHCSGKKDYKADILSIYPEIDIAVLKINNYTNKSYLKLGNSDTCVIGSDMIAVGYPLESTTPKITKGSISGRENYLIQTDTTINEGNSGGALLNSSYEVIGINGSKMTGETIEGVGYSIPINLFKNVKDDMTDIGILEKYISKNMSKNKEVLTIYAPNLYCKFQSLDRFTSHLICHNYYKVNRFDKDKNIIEGCMVSLLYKKSPLSTCPLPMKVMDILMEFDGKKIDMFGDIESDDMGELNSRLNINDYVLRCKIDVPIRIKFFSAEKQSIVETSIMFKNHYFFSVRKLFHSKKVDSITIDGIVISELTLDHVIAIINERYSTSIINKANMYSFMLSENREEPKIFISRVLPQSDSIINKNLKNSEFCVIRRVNGEYVSTIEQFKNACEKYSFDIDGKTYIHMEMMNNEHVTLCLSGLNFLTT
jgi:S1-C subfamily serine protease